MKGKRWWPRIASRANVFLILPSERYINLIKKRLGRVDQLLVANMVAQHYRQLCSGWTYRRRLERNTGGAYLFGSMGERRGSSKREVELPKG